MNNQFELDVKKFIEKAGNNAELAFKKVCLEFSNAVIDDTPKDTGRLKNAWIPSIDSPSSAKDGGGKDAIPTATTSLKLGDTFYLTNNMPYAPVVEFGLYPQPSKTGKTINGFSAKAPQGMVRINIVKFNDFMKKATEGIK